MVIEKYAFMYTRIKFVILSDKCRGVTETTKNSNMWVRRFGIRNDFIKGSAWKKRSENVIDNICGCENTIASKGDR